MFHVDEFCPEHKCWVEVCADQAHPWKDETGEPDFVPTPEWLERDPFVERRD